METHSVTSTDVTLSARDWPHPDGPTVILVHGYPDSQIVWEPVANQLAEEHGLRVITYDVRGAGRSTTPPDRHGYRTERLIDDLVAVLDYACGSEGGGVHLVGHDWGSMQLWDAVTTEDIDERLSGRLLSFTSIGGPSLDHLAHVMRRARNERDLNLLVRQGLHSWYVYAFQLPWLPEQLWRRATRQLRRRIAATEHLGDAPHWGETLAEDASNGLNLYRANIQDRMRHPRAGKTNVPVQLIVPKHDNYVVAEVFADLEEFVPELTRVDVDGGHWVTVQRPDLVARLVAEHVRAHEPSR